MKLFLLKTAVALLLLSFGTEAVFIFQSSTALITTTSDMEESDKGKAFEEDNGKEKECQHIYAPISSAANMSYIISSNTLLLLSQYLQLPEIPPDNV